jgi:hypothetical protein
MTPSVSPEAEWELTEGALFYAREGGACRASFAICLAPWYWRVPEHMGKWG